jgi:hypothetical protein
MGFRSKPVILAGYPEHMLKPFQTCLNFSYTGGHLDSILFVDDDTQLTTIHLLPDKKQDTWIATYQHYQANVHTRGDSIKRVQ